jgi:4-amino-4-deoxy-L-arabinose transferase-like glycosyltransferase
MPPFRTVFDRATFAFVAALILVAGLRIYGLLINPLDLYFDEAQYWMWSRELAWGYFSKPPLVAWAIAATTAVFGDAEWAVRLASPLAHSIGAIALFALGRSMYGAWAGFWAGLGWLLLPGVAFSSNIISTDALLLPLWSIALFSMWRLITTRAWVWAAVLGAAIGLGALAKYAMLYFVLCSALAAWWVAPVRQALGGGRALLAAAIMLAILAPNIVWNVQNDFATAQHTAANADFNLDDLFHFGELWEFLTGQAGVIGPVFFVVLVWLLWRSARRSSGISLEDKFLLLYIVPPLIVVSAIAFLSRANANWAAVSYPAIVVWISGALLTSVGGRRVLAAATAVNVALGAGFIAVTMMLDPALTNRIKGVRSTRAWEESAAEIAARAIPRPGEQPFTAVLVDDRATYFELSYYWRHLRREGAPLPPLRMWVLHNEARNSAEQIDPMRAEEGGRVLVAHLSSAYLPFVADDFNAFRTVEPLQIPLGGDYNRTFEISIGEGFSPAPRDAAFEERVRRLQRGERE